jgi:hypothetical protein
MATKSENDLIDDGFEEAFGEFYKRFAVSYGTAHTQADKDAAIATFRANVVSARNIRDAAKGNLPLSANLNANFKAKAKKK